MLFSIVVPVYRVEKYLIDCVESILQQSYMDFELILVDDGSPDSCPIMCDGFAQNDSRIKVIHQQNAGPACARNAGIMVAEGDYLICIDSDDYLVDKSILAKIAEKASTGVDVILLGYRKLFESNGKLGEKVVPIINDVANTDTMLRETLRNDTYCGTAWTKAVRLSVLRDNGIEFRPGMISEDIDWFLHLMCYAKTFSSINDVAVIYRQRAGSLSHAAKLNSLTDNIWILEYWPKHIKDTITEESTVLALFNVLAYYYANDMVLFAGYPAKVSRPYKNRMKEVSWLLDYAVTPRAITVRRFFKLLGFDITVVLLRILGQLKTRQ